MRKTIIPEKVTFWNDWDLNLDEYQSVKKIITELYLIAYKKNTAQVFVTFTFLELILYKLHQCGLLLDQILLFRNI